VRRRRLFVLFVAGCPLGGLLAALPSPTIATPAGGHSFSWVGSRINHDADNHSWTDPRNWSPEGVPGDGDVASIVSPQTEPCDVHVDTVPQGLELANLLLSTSTTKGCHASLSGGSITVLSTMEWTGGTLDTPVVMSAGSGLQIGDEPVHVIERLRQPLEVLGGGLRLAKAHIRIQDGGSIQLDQSAATSVTFSTDINDVRTDGGPSGIVNRGSLTLFATLSLDSVGMQESGPVDIAPGAELEVRGDRRGMLSGTSLSGGGTLSIASPMDVQGTFSMADGSVLRLQPEGSLDGSSVYTGNGSFEWLGGEISGNDIAFALNDVTVGGDTTKTINDDQGFTSFVQVVSPVTFTPGTRAAPNVLDMNGNSFESFVGETLQRDVEIHDGTFVSSDGPLVIDPGAGGVVRTGVDAQLSSSGSLTVASGRFVSAGELMVNNGPAEVRTGASLRLPVADHPVLLNGGSLTGEGTIDGDIVNSGGIFDPTEGGASAPITLHGSYLQSSRGRLILDLSAESEAIVFDGSVAVSGIVTYENAAGYRPMFGDERRPLSAGEALTWAPTCEETTGTRSGQGHWHSETDQRFVLATFKKGASGSCG